MIDIKLKRNYLDITVQAGMHIEGLNHNQNTIGFLSALEDFLSVLDGYDNVNVVIRNEEEVEKEEEKTYSFGSDSFKYSVNFGGTMASQNFNVETGDTAIESDYREDRQ